MYIRNIIKSDLNIAYLSAHNMQYVQMFSPPMQRLINFQNILQVYVP